MQLLHAAALIARSQHLSVDGSRFHMKPRSWRALSFGAVLGVALVVRLVAAGWWQAGGEEGERFRLPDSDSYWHLAEAVGRGMPYEFPNNEYRIFRAPGYPILLAPLFLMFEDPPVFAARTVGAVLGTLTVGAVMWLSWLLFDRTVALVAGAMTAVYPGSIASSILVLSEAPFCPLMMCQFGMWVVAFQARSARKRGWWMFAAGLTAGVATLVRPSWLLFTPFAVVCALPLRQRTRGFVVFAGATLAGIALAMWPWWMRNYQLVHRFVPTTLQVGASLYDGLNADATGASDMGFTFAFYWDQKKEDRASARSEPLPEDFEVRLDRRMRDAALAWARQNPGQALQLAGVKFLRFWTPWPQARDLASTRLRLVIAATYLPVLMVGLVAAWRYRAAWPCLMCLLPAAYFTLLHMIFVSSIRYRQPAMLPLLVLSAGFLCRRSVRRHVVEAAKEDPV